MKILMLGLQVYGFSIASKLLQNKKILVYGILLRILFYKKRLSQLIKIKFLFSKSGYQNKSKLSKMLKK